MAFRARRLALQLPCENVTVAPMAGGIELTQMCAPVDDPTQPCQESGPGGGGCDPTFVVCPFVATEPVCNPTLDLCPFATCEQQSGCLTGTNVEPPPQCPQGFLTASDLTCGGPSCLEQCDQPSDCPGGSAPLGCQIESCQNDSLCADTNAVFVASAEGRLLTDPGALPALRDALDQRLAREGHDGVDPEHVRARLDDLDRAERALAEAGDDQQH